MLCCGFFIQAKKSNKKIRTVKDAESEAEDWSDSDDETLKIENKELKKKVFRVFTIATYYITKILNTY